MADSAPVPTAEPSYPPRPPAPDPLTMAAARDTGMPGFRIVATAPPESALPPLPPEELERRRRRESRRMQAWRLAVSFVALFVAGAIIDRVNPAFRHGNLPPTEWVMWLLIYAAIVAVPVYVLVEWLPRGVRRFAATRSGGR